MKNIFLLFGLLLLAAVTFSQAPQAFKYQAVARNSSGEPLENQGISVLISILAGNPSGTVVYSEQHQTTTNSLGLFDLEIGNPDEVLSGIFSEINWGTGSYFLKLELDETGGSNYQLMGISQLLSVPYALLSENTVNNDDADADPTNELQTISKDGQIVALSNGGGSFTDEVNDADADPTNEFQTILKDGQTVILSNNGGSFTDDVDDADADPVNELQTLSQNGLEVILSQGGGTVLVADNDNDPANELQQVTRIGNEVTLSQNGGTFSVDDADANPTNELQSLANTKIGNLVSLEIAGGTGTTLDVSDTDSDPVNELQTLTQNGLEVSLSQGGGTINVADNDNQPANELQQLTKVGNVVTLSQNGGSFTDEVDDADANSSNELQNLSNTKNGNLIELDISNGNGTILDVTDSDADPVNELQILTQTGYQVTMSQGGGSIMTGVKSYTQTEIDVMTPYTGLTVHNVTTNCINYYFNGNWYEACGTCLPQPTQANAGADQHFTDATTSTTLEGNTPASGTGLWTIVSGDGGAFEDAANPTTTFTGMECEDYVLRWSISTSCTTKSDDVSIDFDYQPTVPDAGPDQIGLPGTTTNLAGNTPVEGTGLWTIVSGEGGSFGDPSNPSSSFTGVQNVDYVVAWTISTPCVTLSNDVNIRFWSCGIPIIDIRDGKSYNTVQIGTQCWMAQNLNVGTFSTNQTNNAIIEKYCHSNSEANCAEYGGLYRWDEMMEYSTTPGIQGICLNDWHIPTITEWDLLMTFLVDNVGGKMKETGTAHWNPPNTGATNSSGFTAFGSSWSGGTLKNEAFFWSSNGGTGSASCRYLYSNSANLMGGGESTTMGFAVRCVKD